MVENRRPIRTHRDRPLSFDNLVADRRMAVSRVDMAYLVPLLPCELPMVRIARMLLTSASSNAPNRALQASYSSSEVT